MEERELTQYFFIQRILRPLLSNEHRNYPVTRDKVVSECTEAPMLWEIWSSRGHSSTLIETMHQRNRPQDSNSFRTSLYFLSWLPLASTSSRWPRLRAFQSTASFRDQLSWFRHFRFQHEQWFFDSEQYFAEVSCQHLLFVPFHTFRPRHAFSQYNQLLFHLSFIFSSNMCPARC